MENPIKMDDLGVPQFLGNIHIIKIYIRIKFRYSTLSWTNYHFSVVGVLQLQAPAVPAGSPSSELATSPPVGFYVQKMSTQKKKDLQIPKNSSLKTQWQGYE